MQYQNTIPKTLTIAGSDSGGGAGIQADLKTFSALKTYGMSCLVALTAQNTQGVNSIHPVPEDFVKEQIKAVFEDIGVDSVKIGMLFSSEIIKQVAQELHVQKAGNIVLDPVMVSQNGDKLLQDNTINTMVSDLFPLTTIITPNLMEAEVLLDRKINGEEEEMEKAAKDLGKHGSDAVLLKGGHSAQGEAIDYLYYKKKDKVYHLTNERTETTNTHGTGCTLSSAISAHLARGFSLVEAVEEAKSYITGAIKAGSYYQIGQGSGPVHHFFRFW